MKVLFIVPAEGRLDMSRVCLGQLKRTCVWLEQAGIEAQALVIAHDENLDIAYSLGLQRFLCAPNSLLGRKFNNGYEHAHQAGYSHCVPMGSDDWLDPAWLVSALLQEPEGHVVAPRRWTAVHEDGHLAMPMHMTHDGGLGIRVIPTALLEPLGYRPCHEDKRRGIDQSTWRQLQKAHGGRCPIVYRDEHDLQLVDWKSHGMQLNTFQRSGVWSDLHLEPYPTPWDELVHHYGPDAVGEMRLLHRARTAVLS